MISHTIEKDPYGCEVLRADCVQTDETELVTLLRDGKWTLLYFGQNHTKPIGQLFVLAHRPCVSSTSKDSKTPSGTGS